jgi:hypothetical protein
VGLKDFLAKARLIEPEPVAAPARPAPAPSKGPAPAPQAQAKRPPSPESIKAILASIPKAEPIPETSLPEPPPGGDLPDLDAIYAAAGVVAPRHGFTALKVLEMLDSKQLAGLDGRSRAAALGAFLQAHPGGPVAIEDVLQDAVRRDQALDAFDGALRAKLRARAEQVERQNAQLQAEIDAVARRNRQLMDENLATLEGDRRQIDAWQGRKRAEEQRLFDAVAPFVEENPVTLGGVAPARSPDEVR